ncbi:hypothetical protein C2845_PM05G25130 [Panicum miliaceum]|uniref:Uncharacterized protein n=1 Tax=Panicum miliaceum TaxID=4540 RepID=A0A3L6SYL3_PANMI|nr:hypothetical protein C2845_PM05G25130 [Panicum miliaceum]
MHGDGRESCIVFLRVNVLGGKVLAARKLTCTDCHPRREALWLTAHATVDG